MFRYIFSKICARCILAILIVFMAMPVSALAQYNARYSQGKQQGDFLIRGRIIGLLPDEETSVPALGGDVDAGDEYAPELDITYFFTDNIAAELVLATTNHDMVLEGSSAGDVDLGEVWLLPPAVRSMARLSWIPGCSGPVSAINFSARGSSLRRVIPVSLKENIYLA